MQKGMKVFILVVMLFAIAIYAIVNHKFDMLPGDHGGGVIEVPVEPSPSPIE